MNTNRGFHPEKWMDLDIGWPLVCGFNNVLFPFLAGMMIPTDNDWTMGAKQWRYHPQPWNHGCSFRCCEMRSPPIDFNSKWGERFLFELQFFHEICQVVAGQIFRSPRFQFQNVSNHPTRATEET